MNLISKTDHDTKILQLKKKVELVIKNIGLDGQQCQVICCMDVSGSMRNMYKSGQIQHLTDRLLAIGLNIDTDKSIDMYGFGVGVHSYPKVNSSNVFQYVESNVYPKTSLEGGTYYAKVMERIIKDSYPHAKEAPAEHGLFSMFSHKKKNSNQKYMTLSDKISFPTFVLFITDGQNGDETEAENIITKCSSLPIFWQFVGIGNETFSFLEELDTMDGRFVDNANFFACNDINNISDEDLYHNLLKEFPSWIKLAKTNGILI